MEASRVRGLFSRAKKEAPLIIFIDEIDDVAKSRDGRFRIVSNDEREKTLNQLLTVIRPKYSFFNSFKYYRGGKFNLTTREWVNMGHTSFQYYLLHYFFLQPILYFTLVFINELNPKLPMNNLFTNSLNEIDSHYIVVGY